MPGLLPTSLIAAAVGNSLILLSRIYERSVPKFLTPLVDQVAPFRPGNSTFGPRKR